MKRILCYLIFCLLPWQLAAQSGQEIGLPLITNYSPKMYKGDQQVWSIVQDKQGLMYFGTSAGLMEYDGVKWRRVFANKINSTFSHEAIRALAKDKHGVVYYGGNGSIGYLDKDTFGNTHAVSLLAHIPEEYRGFNGVWSVYSTGDSLYFQAREYIFKIGAGAGKRAGTSKVWKPETAFMYAFYLDGTYYVHQQGLGLYKMVGNELQRIPGSEFLGEDRMQVMLPYPSAPQGEKQYLLATFSGGIFLFAGNTLKSFPTQLDDMLSSGARIYKAIQLNNGSYAFAFTGKGLLLMDKEGRLLNKFNLETGLISNASYVTYQDQSGMLWLGTDNGISRVEISSPITYFNEHQGINSSVQSIKRSEGDLYVGTSLGLFRFDKSRQAFERDPVTKAQQVFSLEKDGEDLLVSGDGLYAIIGGQTLPIRVSTGGDFIVAKILVSKVQPDLLFCGGGFGLAIFSRRKSSSREAGVGSWHFEGFVPGISKFIYSIAESPQGDVWAGDHVKTIYRIELTRNSEGSLDLQNSSVEEYNAEQGDVPFIGSVFSAGSKTFFPAISGFYTFDETNKGFVKDSTFGKAMTGRNPINFTIVEDDIGRVFVQWGDKQRLAIPKTGGGYELDDNFFSTLTGESFTSIYSEANGITWIGTNEGLIRFDEKVNQNRGQPLFTTLLRQVTSGKDTLNLQAQLSGSTYAAPALPFQSSSLRFSYAAPFFEQEHRTLYQTFLEGFDEEWSGWDSNFYKEFTNLPAGNYRFRVRAKNIHNSVSDEAIYAFTIYPPWHGTWWAYLIYAMLFAGGVLGLVHYRSKSLKRENQILEEKVDHRTKQLQQSLENLKAAQAQLVQQEKLASLGQLTAGIAHEIKNPLNFVNNFSVLNVELLEEVFEEAQKLEQNETLEEITQILEDVKANLQKIHQHGSRADSIVESMLQHSRGGSGKMEPTDLNALIKENVNLSFHGIRAGKQPIDAAIELQLDEHVGQVPLNAEDFSRVILNLCNNAFEAMREKVLWNPTAAYSPKLTLRTTRTAGEVQVIVIDNGPGIPEENKDKILQPFFTTKKGTDGTGLGLSITHDIVKAHGGTLAIHSKEDSGTTIVVHLAAK